MKEKYSLIKPTPWIICKVSEKRWTNKHMGNVLRANPTLNKPYTNLTCIMIDLSDYECIQNVMKLKKTK